MAEEKHNVDAETSRTLLYRSGDQVLDWDQYFMNIAYATSLRSKDPKCQVGACIVNEFNRLVGTGYNGMPDQFTANNSATNSEASPRSNDNNEVWDPSNKRYLVCHAEANAILNSFGRSLQNCRMYVTRIPCNECAKLIVQSGISEVICHSMKPFASNYGNPSDAGKAAMTILERAQVKIRTCRPDMNKISILQQSAFEANDKHINQLID